MSSLVLTAGLRADGKRRWKGPAAAGVLLLALAALTIFAPLISHPAARQGAFLVSLVLLVFEFIAIGHCLGRGSAGLIVDARNCMSLSKLQACAWTILVLAALLAGTAFTLQKGSWSMRIPQELLEAMGISGVSLAAAPALLSLKTQQTPTAAALGSAGITPQQGADAPPPPDAPPAPNVGALMFKPKISDAHWTDMITGDEVGNFTTPDLGKIQQLLVTLLLVGGYGVFVFKSFAGRGEVAALPSMNDSLVWLLGVSHASYLAYKAAPHTTTN